MGRIWERSKGDRRRQSICPTSLPESFSLETTLLDPRTTRKDPELEWWATDNLETNPITIKSKTVSHVAEQSSWVPSPFCSPPGCPFPIKSLALSASVSPWTIHFWVLDKSPLLGPGSSPPSCNRKKQERRRLGVFHLLVFSCATRHVGS